MASPPSSDRRLQYITVVFLLLVLALFVPLLAVGSFVLALLGGCCVRSAMVHRGEGWMAGAMLGIILALAGAVGTLAFLGAWLFRH